jgi:two-component system, repressor protein LuxO
MCPPSDTILLVEDTPSLQMIYAAALDRAGYAVEVCGTAADGRAPSSGCARRWCCWT